MKRHGAPATASPWNYNARVPVQMIAILLACAAMLQPARYSQS